MEFKQKYWKFGISLEIPKNIFGFLEFPWKFQNSKIPVFLERCFEIQANILEFWNFLGNCKKQNLEFPRKFPNSKISIFFERGFGGFGINNSKKYFWKFIGNFKIPIFLVEFQIIFKTIGILVFS